MPWLSRRELVRLERETQRAVQRAIYAEGQLAEERRAKDALVVQLASRVVTKHGGYGLDNPAPIPPAPETANNYTHEPTEMDKAKLDYYKRQARAAGQPEELAQQIWEAELRGEQIVYPYETEQSEHEM